MQIDEQNIDPDFKENEVISSNGYRSFVFWETIKIDYLDVLDSNPQKLEFYNAIVDYGLYGKIPHFEEKLLNALWKPLQRQMLNQQIKRNHKVENGKRGGRKATLGFQKPTKEEIIDYCTEKNLKNIDVDYFYDFNEARGWYLSSGSPMKDWKQTLQHWNKHLDWNPTPTLKNNSFNPTL